MLYYIEFCIVYNVMMCIIGSNFIYYNYVLSVLQVLQVYNRGDIRHTSHYNM